MLSGRFNTVLESNFWCLGPLFENLWNSCLILSWVVLKYTCWSVKMGGMRVVIRGGSLFHVLLPGTRSLSGVVRPRLSREKQIRTDTNVWNSVTWPYKQSSRETVWIVIQILYQLKFSLCIDFFSYLSYWASWKLIWAILATETPENLLLKINAWSNDKSVLISLGESSH